MPASTTLKLPDDLKRRIVPLAESAGKTPHAWMIEALENQAALAERRRAFVTEALATEKEVKRSGKAYKLGDVREYMRNLARGRSVKRPKPAKW